MPIKLNKKFTKLVKYYKLDMEDLKPMWIHMTLKEFKQKVDEWLITLYWEDWKKIELN